MAPCERAVRLLLSEDAGFGKKSEQGCKLPVAASALPGRSSL